jgi:CBS domain-containing protein
MLVKAIMTRTVATVRPEMTLGAAVEIMWNRNVGILPVVNAENKPIGVVTDRDICIALGTRNRLPGNITVSEVATGKLIYCRPDDEIHSVLALMAEGKVRRLPVINEKGEIEGILSMDDVLLHSETGRFGRAPDLSFDEAAAALKRLYRPELPELVREKKVMVA